MDDAIYELAPPGAVPISGMPIGTKVGHTVAVDGEDLGVVAATHYDHARRDLGVVCALVPPVVYWDLRVRYLDRVGGWEVKPLTAQCFPGHEALSPPASVNTFGVWIA
jgi:hypothetical protein